MDIWDVVKNDIMNISLKTEFLEACGWDEDEMSSSILIFEEILKNLKIEEQTQNTIFINIQQALEEELGYTKASILLKMIDKQKNELIKLMDLPEN